MSIAQQTTTSTTAAPSSTAPPRPNFPLPRELRDAIYAYLLDAEYVQTPPYQDRCDKAQDTTPEGLDSPFRAMSMAHTYQFHTSILAVNKTIHIEAKKLFYKNNFVMIDYCWPALSDILHQYDVPMIVDERNQISESRDSAAAILLIQHSSLDEDTWHGTMTLAGRDMPIFRQAMQWLFKRSRAVYDLVVPGDGDGDAVPIGIQNDRTKVVKTCIIITNPNDTSQAAKELKTQIQLLSVPGQEVRVYYGGFGLHQELLSKELEETMGCRRIDASTFLFGMLKSALIIKKRADKFVCRGEQYYKDAFMRYFSIAHCWRWDIFRDYKQNSRLMEATQPLLSLLLRLVLDAMNAAAELSVKLRGLQHASFLFDMQWDVQQDMLRVMGVDDHLSFIFSASGSHIPLISGLLMEGNPESLVRAIGVMEELQSFDRRLPMTSEHDIRLKHDIGVLNRVLRDPALLEKSKPDDSEEVWQSLSCCHFPARLFDSGLYDYIDQLDDNRAT